MVVVSPADTFIGQSSQKKIGRGLQFGRKLYGNFEYGETEPVMGIGQYGVRDYGKTRYAQVILPFGIYQIRSEPEGQITVKKEFYVPNNPQTETQQAHRQKYGQGVEAWNNLTPEQKAVYNQRAKYKNLSGYNLYLREYLLSH